MALVLNKAQGLSRVQKGFSCSRLGFLELGWITSSLVGTTCILQGQIGFRFDLFFFVMDLVNSWM